jgi:hypothetical protein
MPDITLTWGDILVHSLIAIGVAALLAIVVKYIFPWFITLFQWLGDVWAAMKFFSGSDRRVRRRITRLEQKLTKYNNDFADNTLFFCRIISKLAVLIVIALMIVFCIGYSLLAGIAITLNCVKHHCTSVNINEGAQIIMYFYGSIILFMCFLVAQAILSLELSPEKYRARLMKSISRLQKKLPPVPPSEEAANRLICDIGPPPLRPQH